jgi:hypothetical protein
MTYQQTRRRRSNLGVAALAEWLTVQGWPKALAVPSGYNGTDIRGVPGISFEHKAADEWRLQTWLAEAESRPGLPIVVYQGRGQGPAQVGDWPWIMRAQTGVALLHQAGYGLR